MGGGMEVGRELVEPEGLPALLGEWPMKVGFDGRDEW
ncbi:MAG: hypothetical protein ACI8RZ_007281 [Myxococcota bacterium]|jgi:hypothetical protein